jgi:hypothetical protein
LSALSFLKEICMSVKSVLVFSVLVIACAASALAVETVFTSVPPCVVFDTRPAFGGTGIFAAEEERTFHIVGSTAAFVGQGGTPGGCGVPGFAGPNAVTQSVLINYVAIDAQGGGQLKAWAADQTEPAQGALVNYQLLNPPMNNSNAVVTEVRQDSQGEDITVKARSAGVHVRGVVLGYFTRPTPPSSTNTYFGSVSAIPPGAAWQFAGSTTLVTTSASRPRITAAATAGLATSGSDQTVDIGLCYQMNTGGLISNFVGEGAGSMSVVITPTRSAYSATATLFPPSTGFWVVGFCVRNPGPHSIDNNSTVNGWATVSF